MRSSKGVEELEMLQVSTCEGRQEESRAELSSPSISAWDVRAG